MDGCARRDPLLYKTRCRFSGLDDVGHRAPGGQLRWTDCRPSDAIGRYRRCLAAWARDSATGSWLQRVVRMPRIGWHLIFLARCAPCGRLRCSSNSMRRRFVAGEVRGRLFNRCDETPARRPRSLALTHAIFNPRTSTAAGAFQGCEHRRKRYPCLHERMSIWSFAHALGTGAGRAAELHAVRSVTGSKICIGILWRLRPLRCTRVYLARTVETVQRRTKVAAVAALEDGCGVRVREDKVCGGTERMETRMADASTERRVKTSPALG